MGRLCGDRCRYALRGLERDKDLSKIYGHITRSGDGRRGIPVIRSQDAQQSVAMALNVVRIPALPLSIRVTLSKSPPPLEPWLSGL